MSRLRPLAVAFDVVETLLSLEPVAQALELAGAGPRGLDLFFARLLRDGFALAAAGDYASFADIAAHAAQFVLPDAGAQQRAAVLEAFKDLTAHPDAEPALAALSAGGVRVVTLTNGGAEQTAALLHAAGLAGYVEAVLSVEEPRRWKPAAEPYRWAAGVLGLAPEQLGLVAVHAWDINGAARAGLATGWASRLEGTFPDFYRPADVTGPDLVSVVQGLLALGQPQEET